MMNDSGPLRILLVGDPDGVNLESSYQRAFIALGHDVQCFSLRDRVNAYARFGKIGAVFTTFVPVEQWVRKANRELAILSGEGKFDLIVIFGSAPVQAGALAQIKSQTASVVCWVWPDTLLNLSATILPALPLFDAAFTYSSSSLDALKQLGCRTVVWLPLAGDPTMHQCVEIDADARRVYGADVTFIGGWRPEREAALRRISGERLKIWGPDWGRRCKDATLRRSWQGRALRGPEFARAVGASRINLNIIDPTNAPAANMRFFEIPMAGGLQLSSSCREMEPLFRHEEHVIYYGDLDDLAVRVKLLLDDPATCGRVASAGCALVKAAHSYEHRAKVICESVPSIKNKA
jgi:spore maturation protein CgeB